MDRRQDLEIILRSRTPLIVMETRDERRVLRLLQAIGMRSSTAEYMPLFRWTITDGLQRLDIDLAPQLVNSEPADVLKHIRAVSKPGIYTLLDFHPFLDDPVHIRLIKDICIHYPDIPRQLVFISHKIELPRELEAFSARVDIALPGDADRKAIIESVAREYSAENSGLQVQVDPTAYEMLVRNLAGLTYADTERLARNAIQVDGAITHSDLPGVMQAKYELLNQGGALHFEYDTARFSDVGGLNRLKTWLSPERDTTNWCAGLRQEPGCQGDCRYFQRAVAQARFRRAVRQVSRRDRTQVTRVSQDRRRHVTLCPLDRRNRKRHRWSWR
jgi:hypothetical protein